MSVYAAVVENACGEIIREVRSTDGASVSNDFMSLCREFNHDMSVHVYMIEDEDGASVNE